ncbi:uncharacterized protein LOC105664864, partial [Ceratitis capitata]|uniref:uncharacterized protein LOC105664864 n=1 Tax=Ceratitis capitata TaxID=7213 RepID=UPI000A11B2BA
KNLKALNLGGQLTGPEREIKCSRNSPLTKSIVTRAMWYVALTIPRLRYDSHHLMSEQAQLVSPGDMEYEQTWEISSKLPITSEAQLQGVETQLKTKSYTEAMFGLLVKTKSRKGSVDGVLRFLFGDQLMSDYNLEGRRGKKTLLKLKCLGIVFDVFAERTKENLFLDIRNYISLSHNRYKQYKHKLKVKLGLQKLKNKRL